MSLEDFSDYGNSNQRKTSHQKKEEDILNIHEPAISSISPISTSSKTTESPKKSFFQKKSTFLAVGIVLALLIFGGMFWFFHSSSLTQEDPITSSSNQTQGTQSLGSPVVSFYDHQYQIVNEKVSWKEAFSRAYEAGGYLATLNTLDEEAFLDALVQDSALEEYWIGGYFDYADGFSWVTGEPWNYENWVNRLYYTDPEILSNLDVVAIEKASLEWDLLEDNEKTTAGYIIEWGEPDYSEVTYEEDDINNHVISSDLQKIIDAAEVIYNFFQ